MSGEQQACFLSLWLAEDAMYEGTYRISRTAAGVATPPQMIFQ